MIYSSRLLSLSGNSVLGTTVRRRGDPDHLCWIAIPVPIGWSVK